MAPFLVFWENVTDEWLVSRTACALFGGAAFLGVALTTLLVTVPPDGEPTLALRVAWGALGVSGTMGLFFLWSGMWVFWKKCDSSSRWVRRLSFAILVVGLCYGAVVYFLLVFLPFAVRTDFRPKPAP
jgi:putative flippase GtrA